MSKQYLFIYGALESLCHDERGFMLYFLAFRHLRRPTPEDSVCRACFVWWVGVSEDDNGKVVCYR